MNLVIGMTVGRVLCTDLQIDATITRSGRKWVIGITFYCYVRFYKNLFYAHFTTNMAILTIILEFNVTK